MERLDLLIIGGSAVATASAIYGARRKLNMKVVSMDWGGEVSNSGEIGNFPGFIQTNGIELVSIFKKQLQHNQVDIVEDVKIESIKKKGEGDFVSNGIKDGKKIAYYSKAVIIGTGVHPRELSAKGEKELRNRGVSYCTTCDGPLFRGKSVATIGGGNSALESALLLKEICPKVYILTINDDLQGETIYIEKLKKAKNVEIITSASTQEFKGKNSLEKLIYKDRGGSLKELSVQGAFIHIGVIPNSSFLPKEIKVNNFKEIIINKLCETSVSGIFAAGDVTDTPFKQIAIAIGQGTTAVLRAIQYIDQIK